MSDHPFGDVWRNAQLAHATVNRPPDIVQAPIFERFPGGRYALIERLHSAVPRFVTSATTAKQKILPRTRRDRSQNIGRDPRQRQFQSAMVFCPPSRNSHHASVDVQLVPAPTPNLAAPATSQ